ncbi:hypothetical protein KR026_003132, partial [Drosophila bipectinata]
VNVLVDQLEQPWSARKLVRILKNNLRPEIPFLDDVKHAHGYSKVTPFKREVSELIQEADSLERSESEGELEVDAFSLVCWNCRKEEHRYQDCLSEKRVFCYGCGTANTYKPNCVKCAKNLKPGISKSQYKQK